MSRRTTTLANSPTRRDFLTTSLCRGAGLLLLPGLSRCAAVRRPGRDAPIQVAQVGCGRMGREDMGGVLRQSLARVVAVCDVDEMRLAAGKALAEEHYRKQGESSVSVAAFRDVSELLSQPGIDALVVSTPDHSHGWIAVAAALAGRHLYVQKPLTYDVHEALVLRRIAQAKGIVLQTGSQQRSEQPWAAFRIAMEAVRHGRIGRVREVRIGLGTDAPSGRKPAPGEPPAHLDYDRWLGPAPRQDYMEGRVHPQESYGRPGWITTECFGLGMITNWGAHHLDVAQWALGRELSGPVAIEGRAEFMTDDLWTVHRGYHVELGYEDGVRVVLDDSFEVGLEFIGDEGTLFCTRAAGRVTASDPNAGAAGAGLRASAPRLLEALPDAAVRLPRSDDHYRNWLLAIRDGIAPVAPVDQAARSLTACYLSWLAMRLGRKLRWDPAAERIVGDDDAQSRLRRAPRAPEFDVDAQVARAGA
jgi:predicted dehydrogenase